VKLTPAGRWPLPWQLGRRSLPQWRYPAMRSLLGVSVGKVDWYGRGHVAGELMQAPRKFVLVVVGAPR
jgi:hypothetical protein